MLTAGEVPRVVFDTNVLLSLWVFKDSRFAALRAAIDGGGIVALTNPACMAELARVLAYPQFKLEAAAQARILADYAAAARMEVGLCGERIALPKCKDKDDQKFLELARDAGAQYLVTGDKALLVLARRKPLAEYFRIVTPEMALGLLQPAIEIPLALA